MTLAAHLRRLPEPVFRAYRRVPVRWRLGGGSAALTFVILAGVAGVTAVLTDRHISTAFYQQQSGAAQQFSGEIAPTITNGTVTCNPAITQFGADLGAQIRLFGRGGHLLCSSAYNSNFSKPINVPRFHRPRRVGTSYVESGYHVDSALVAMKPQGKAVMVYAEPLSNLNETIREIRVYLAGGVLAGTILAMLAGLLVAQRAMRPVVELTEAAREIERTRDPSLRMPHPEAEDEVADLARTLEAMLGALNAARHESESALMRQREFVADASHELRTPLTSVLANLELLADELDGEQADSAKSALRSTRRMRRLVADLLLLARADVGREQPHRLTDLATHLTEAAAELGAGLDGHAVTFDAEPAPVEGFGDDLHRLILNLVENALNHTPDGTHIWASTGMRDGHAVLVVEDDGPGIEPELQRRVFERFVRGGGDTGSRGTGLGLAIVDAVATAHGATVRMTSLPELQGTRFEIRFPEAVLDEADAALPATAELSLSQGGAHNDAAIGRARPKLGAGRRRSR